MPTPPETPSNQKVSVEAMFWGGHVVVSRQAGILLLYNSSNPRELKHRKNQEERIACYVTPFTSTYCGSLEAGTVRELSSCGFSTVGVWGSSGSPLPKAPFNLASFRVLVRHAPVSISNTFEGFSWCFTTCRLRKFNKDPIASEIAILTIVIMDYLSTVQILVHCFVCHRYWHSSFGHSGASNQGVAEGRYHDLGTNSCWIPKRKRSSTVNLSVD